MSIRKGYTDGPFGQVHWRLAGDGEKASKTDLFCLHPSPFSGLAYTGMMPYLAPERRIIAPDYPGYGGSDPCAGEPSVEVYAGAVMAVMDAFSAGAPVDLAGFHTGCLVAAHIAHKAPDRVRKICLIDVPAFPEAARADMLEKTAKPLELTADIECLAPAWASGIVKRLESQPMERAFEMFVEQIRPGRHMNAAFQAAFSYDWEKVFPRLETQAMVLATKSPLLEGSRKTAEMIPGATLVERLDIVRAVLDEAAEITSGEVAKYLDAD